MPEEMHVLMYCNAISKNGNVAERGQEIHEVVVNTIGIRWHLDLYLHTYILKSIYFPSAATFPFLLQALQYDPINCLRL